MFLYIFLQNQFLYFQIATKNPCQSKPREVATLSSIMLFDAPVSRMNLNGFSVPIPLIVAKTIIFLLFYKNKTFFPTKAIKQKNTTPSCMSFLEYSFRITKKDCIVFLFLWWFQNRVPNKPPYLPAMLVIYF